MAQAHGNMEGRASQTSRADSSTTTLPVPPDDQTPLEEHIVTKDFGFLPIPKNLRHDPNHPAHFGLLLNITFGFCGTFVLANLYYCQPLLIQFSKSFGVTYDEVSRIPTLVQVGYAAGLLFISTLGDLVRRRPLIIALVFIAASLSVGLAFTTNLAAFEALNFLTGAFTIVPQILLPLAADLAPPERRATAMSIVLSGLLLGILIARVIAGTIAQYVTWRVVYYMAFAMQYVVVVWLYLVLPDYPAKNKGATYFGILFSMAKLAVTEPMLVQAVLISIPSSACYTNFWVTLTFLLGGPPYEYSTLVIGLFGLVGMVGVALAPLVGRAIDVLVPWFASVIAVICYVIINAIGVGANGVNVASVVIVCIGLDVFRQMVQVSLTTAVFSLDANARARINAVILISLFIGQVMGTSVGSKLFTTYGWRAAAGASLGWSGLMLIAILARGPHVPRYTWVGYAGGCEIRKNKVADMQERQDEESRGPDPAITGSKTDQGHQVIVDGEARDEKVIEKVRIDGTPGETETLSRDEKQAQPTAQ